MTRFRSEGEDSSLGIAAIRAVRIRVHAARSILDKVGGRAPSRIRCSAKSAGIDGRALAIESGISLRGKGVRVNDLGGRGPGCQAHESNGERQDQRVRKGFQGYIHFNDG